ncbi:MAG: beta-ketoacyl synthase N-terminal-like domain-containing protein [Pseudomonadota bacterium]
MAGCYFIGAGLHTTLGNGVEANLAALEGSFTPPPRATARYAGREQQLPYRTLRDVPLPGDDAAAEQLRLDAVLDATIGAALEQAQLSNDERARTGLFVGTSSFDIGVSEAEYREALLVDAAALPLDRQPSASLGQFALRMRARHGLRGPDFSFNTACTASANALLHADAMVRSGRLRHALVVGVECFNAITALGFQGLQLLSPDNMKPFDPARNGLVLGEACAALVLGPEARRGSFFLRGGANLCDTHSMSAANPDGSTVALVMQRALRSAGLEPRDITALKTHGTASLLNDEAEAAGMHQLFEALPPVCALKPWLGHTLGACGLNELVLFCAAAKRGFLIGTPGIAAQSDLGIELNQQSLDLPAGNFMLNYFGFGGNNTSLVVVAA